LYVRSKNALEKVGVGPGALLSSIDLEAVRGLRGAGRLTIMDIQRAMGMSVAPRRS